MGWNTCWESNNFYIHTLWKSEKWYLLIRFYVKSILSKCLKKDALLHEFLTRFSWNQRHLLIRHTVWKNYCQTRSQFYGKINIFSVKSTLSLKSKELVNELISRKFLSVIAFFSTFPHCGHWISDYFDENFVKSTPFFWVSVIMRWYINFNWHIYEWYYQFLRSG